MRFRPAFFRDSRFAWQGRDLREPGRALWRPDARNQRRRRSAVSPAGTRCAADAANLPVGSRAWRDRDRANAGRGSRTEGSVGFEQRQPHVRLRGNHAGQELTRRSVVQFTRRRPRTKRNASYTNSWRGFEPTRGAPSSRTAPPPQCLAKFLDRVLQLRIIDRLGHVGWPGACTARSVSWSFVVTMMIGIWLVLESFAIVRVARNPLRFGVPRP